MIGTIIGGALGLGASIYGNIKVGKEARKARGILAQKAQDNENWFERRYNEDATQRADAQRLLSITEERIRNRNRQASGASAVMGATDESVALAKGANNQALADVAGGIASDASRRKDAIEGQYQARKDAIQGQIAGTHMQQAGAISQAASQLANVGAGIAEVLDTPKSSPSYR